METNHLIKSQKANSEYRVSGYLVRFTDANDVDLHGEYFDKSTYFWEKERPIKGIPILIDHAFDSRFKGLPVGIVDFVKEDEIGIWIEGKLKERDEYLEYLQHMRAKGVIEIDDKLLPTLANNIEKAVKAFFETGQTQWSSGSHPQFVETGDDGHIKSWPFIEATAVMSPAEPDGTEINGVQKALNKIDELLTNIQTAKTQGAKEPNGAKESSVPSADVDNDKSQAQGTNTMDEQINGDLTAKLDAIMAKLEKMFPEEMEDEEVKTELAKMEDDLEEEAKKLGEDATADALAEKAFGLFTTWHNKREADKKAIDDAMDTRFKAWQANLPTDKDAYLPAAKHNNGQQSKSIPFQIQDITPFDNWKAEDYSFAVDLARMSRGTAMPIIDERIVNKAFMNQFADKAIKAYQAGEINVSKGGMKAINAIKADELDYSTQAGYGDEWVFTAWSESIWDKPRLDLVYNQLQTISMPSNPYEVPTESTDPSVYFVAETTDETQLGRNDSAAAIPDTKIATNKIQLNAKKYAMRVNWSAELAEDAIASYLPKFRNQAQRAVEDAIELGVLLGDTSTSGNVNDDGGTPTATNSYLAYDGLWHQALVTATTNAVNATGAAPTLAHIRNVRSKLGNAQGYNPANLAIFTDFPTYMKLLSIDAVVTMDKIGNQATVKTGSLGQIDGINIFVSGQMALADTDGKITNGGNVTNTGRLMIVYLPDWYLGYRRRVASNLDYLKFADAWELVLTVRTALSARSYSSAGAQQSSDDSVAVLYNIGV